MNLLIVGALLFVVFSLGQALFSMARGPDHSGQMARALTRRVAVSVLLFVGILLSWKLGLITPLGQH